MKNQKENVFTQSKIQKKQVSDINWKNTNTIKTIEQILNLISTLKDPKKTSNIQHTLQQSSIQNVQISQFISTIYGFKTQKVEKTIHERKYLQEVGFIPQTQMNVVVLNKIGEGGFGKVYRGKETISGRQVAIKYSLIGTKNISFQAISKEIEINKKVSELKIKGLLEILSCRVVEMEQKKYLETVMELGVSSLKGVFKERQKQNRKWTQDELTKMLINMSQCLGHLAREGINHRDISLHNFVLSQDRTQYKLIDFGHSFLFSNKDVHCVIGKWNYMAPELKNIIYQSKKKIDSKSDQKIKENSLESIFEQNSSLLMQTQITDPNLVSLNYSHT